MGLMAFLATKYAKVTRGEYSGCGLGLGNDRGNKVEVGTLSNQLLFLKGFKEVARVNVDELKSYQVITDTNAELTILLTWKNGKTSTAVTEKIDAQGRIINGVDRKIQELLRTLDKSGAEDTTRH